MRIKKQDIKRLKALAKCCVNDYSRDYLRAIQFKEIDGNLYATATGGQGFCRLKLCEVLGDVEEGFCCYLSGSDIKTLKAQDYYLGFTENEAEFGNGSKLYFQKMEVRYEPPFEKLLEQKTKPVEGLKINPSLLALFTEPIQNEDKSFIFNFEAWESGVKAKNDKGVAIVCGGR